MTVARINGIDIHYTVRGKGTPLLMLAPGGYDATMASWSTRGVWQSLQPLDTLAGEFRMVACDRRESGSSGGRVEPHTWRHCAISASACLRASCGTAGASRSPRSRPSRRAGSRGCPR